MRLSIAVAIVVSSTICASFAQAHTVQQQQHSDSDRRLHKEEEVEDADADDASSWNVDKWSNSKNGNEDGASRQHKQRRLGTAWSSSAWDAPKYSNNNNNRKQNNSNNYYRPASVPAPTPYYPPPEVPEFIETCCVSGESVCPVQYPMEKQVLLYGTVRVCCFTSRVSDYYDGRYFPISHGRYGGGGGGYYGGGSYGYGHGNRKLQYYSPPQPQGFGGFYYGQPSQPSYSYGNSYELPADCPASLGTSRPTPSPTMPRQTPSPTTPLPTTPLPTPSPTPKPTPSPTPKPTPSPTPKPTPSPTAAPIEVCNPTEYFTRTCPTLGSTTGRCSEGPCGVPGVVCSGTLPTNCCTASGCSCCP